MSDKITEGDLVTHYKYGQGIVLRTSFGGACSVRFPKGESFVDIKCLKIHPDVLRERARNKKIKEEKDEELRREREEKLRPLMMEIRRRLRDDFLSVDPYFQNSCTHLVSLAEFEREKNIFVKSWIQKNTSKINGCKVQVPDDEQVAVIGAVHGNIQVLARAGSGKTSTLVNRAYFLQKHCGVAADEILLLAFNRKAANEIAARLKKVCGTTVPYVMTFHALAHSIVHPTEELIYNDTTEENQGLDNAFSAVIKDRLLDGDFLSEVRKLMIAQFKDDWEELVGGGHDFTPKELYRFQKSLARETLRGEYVKSHGEKVIANFLFEHDIPYNYEKSTYWHGGSIYKPDFTLLPNNDRVKGVIIEYFGLVGDPDYDEQIEEKREYWATKEGYELLELTPSAFVGGTNAFEALLKKKLLSLGVVCNRLSDEEIWLNIKPRAIKRFSNAMSGFVGRCRKAWILPDKLESMVADHESESDVEARFLMLAILLYRDYLERLKMNNQQDFDGLMQVAATIVGDGETIFKRRGESGDLSRLRYVFIDEYQDFSELFHRLVDAIRHINSDVKFFCVGDDWQAINSFAGSNLKFYQNFKSYFPQSKQFHISTNYRSVSSVVSVGNELMAKRGNPSVAYSKAKGAVRMVNLSSFSPTLLEEEKFKNGILTPVVLRIAGKALKKNKSVVLLSRRRDLFLPSGGYMTIEKYLEIIQGYLPTEWCDGVTISTAHSFKGRESDVVIIIDALEGKYPLIHPNWIFDRILGGSVDQVDEENRRLFYVALTRAKEALFIITENGKRSPYLDDIQRNYKVPEIVWGEYPPMKDETGALIVRVSGKFYDLTEELKADGFRFRRHYGKAVREKKYMREGFEIKHLQRTTWALKAASVPDSEIEICVLDYTGAVIASDSIVAAQWAKGDKPLPPKRAASGQTDDPPPMLLERLRILRKGIAEHDGISPYNVFGDTSLAEMVAVMPSDMDEFRQIDGVSLVKLQRYGQEFIKEIADCLKKF